MWVMCSTAVALTYINIHFLAQLSLLNCLDREDGSDKLLWNVANCSRISTVSYAIRPGSLWTLLWELQTSHCIWFVSSMLRSSNLWRRVVWYIGTYFSEERVTSIFSIDAEYSERSCLPKYMALLRKTKQNFRRNNRCPAGNCACHLLNTCQMRSAFFWDITQRRVVILCRRFRITHRFHLQGSRIPWHLKMVVPKRLYRITTLDCVISQKRADLTYIAVDVWNRTRQKCYRLSQVAIL
jgi:hypothetical protein